MSDVFFAAKFRESEVCAFIPVATNRRTIVRCLIDSEGRICLNEILRFFTVAAIERNFNFFRNLIEYQLRNGDVIVGQLNGEFRSQV